MSENDGKVIHVAFGKERRGVVPVARPTPSPRRSSVPVQRSASQDLPWRPLRAEKRQSLDPLSSHYSVEEAARLFGLRADRLRYWGRIGLVTPSGRHRGKRFYTFQDLISIRTAKGLVEAGLSLQQVRRSVETLRRLLPRVARPLAEMRVCADAQSIMVRDDYGTFDALTGQQLLDFRVEALRCEVIEVLRQGPGTAVRRKVAYDCYLDGCRFDEDPQHWPQAEHAYREAVRLDPSFANAMTNLGNLRLRQGDSQEAEELYRQALKVHAGQPEALYNLGCLNFHRGDLQLALQYFEQAVQSDAAFADAHFNLATSYQELGRRAEARPHWQHYLRLQPKGDGADLARKNLAECV